MTGISQISTQDSCEQEVREYRAHPFREAVIVGTIVFVVISIMTLLIYFHTVSAMNAEIREGLARTASVVALSIDGDLHRTFYSPEQEGSPEYSRAIEPLVRTLHGDTTIAFVYTVILKDGKPRFVLDPTPAGDTNGNGIDQKSHIMQEYYDRSPVLMQALRQRKTMTESQPYVDRWGATISGYAPFYDSSGVFVGIVGVDIKADNYYRRLEPIRRATIRAIVTGFFTAFIVSSLVWFMRRFAKIINAKRISLYADLQIERQRGRGSRPGQ